MDTSLTRCRSMYSFLKHISRVADPDYIPTTGNIPVDRFQSHSIN